MQDPESFFYGEADFEQRELEQAGADISARLKRSAKLKAAGRILDAAITCPHSGGYPLRSAAAVNAHDPRQGQTGIRCYDCGSVIDCFPGDGKPRVIHPCEWTPGQDE